MQADATENDIFGRRVLFAGLFATTMVGSLALAALALAPGGFGVIDMTLLALFAVTLPWMVAGFLNALIGFLIMLFSADPIAAVMPAATTIPGLDTQPPTGFRGYARCRLLDDGRRRSPSRPHYAGGSQARHPSGADRRAAVDQRLRARVSVRHAARHALLHHRQRLVAG